MKFTLICLSIFIIGICCQDTLFATSHYNSFYIKWNNDCKKYIHCYGNLDVIVYKNSVTTGADKMNLTVYLTILSAKDNDYKKCQNFFNKSFSSDYFKISSNHTFYTTDGILGRKYLGCDFLVNLQNMSNFKYIVNKELRFFDYCYNDYHLIVNPDEFDKIDERFITLDIIMLIILFILFSFGFINYYI